MLMSIVLIPLCLGLLSLAIPWKKVRRGLLIAGAIGHSAMTAILAFSQQTPLPTGAWIGITSITPC